MSFIEPISKLDFDELLLKTNTFILLDFHASWCGPCVRMKPILENLSQDADILGKVTIYSVDVDAEPDMAEMFSVMGIPAFHLIATTGSKEYKVLKSWVGGMDMFTLKLDIIKSLSDF
jgi:thioredoxin 1